MAEAPSARGRWDPCTVIGYRVNRTLAGLRLVGAAGGCLHDL